mgnify:CR=1 FL=1
MQDLQRIYDELQTRQASLNAYYELLEKGHDKAQESVEAFLNLLDIPQDDESTMAALTRIVNLREDALEQVLEKLDTLIGMDKIKKEINNFISIIKVHREREARGMPVSPLSLHAVFYGPPGTGKTTLIHALTQDIGSDTVVATVPDPGLSLMDFYRYIAKSFGIKEPFETKQQFLEVFETFLLRNESLNKKVLLIIDEAQRLNHDLLEQIRLLSNIEKQDVKLINIFNLTDTFLLVI